MGHVPGGDGEKGLWEAGGHGKIPWENPAAVPAPSYHNPDVEGDAERQVGCGEQDGSLEFMEEEVDQPRLENVSVEEHEEDDDDVEDDGDVLDAAGRTEGLWDPGSPGSAAPPRRHSHEEDELHGRGRAEQLREGIHKEVVGEQEELQEQHQAVVAGLEHPPSRGLEPSAPAFPTDHGAGGAQRGLSRHPGPAERAQGLGWIPETRKTPTSHVLSLLPSSVSSFSLKSPPNPRVRKPRDEGDVQPQGAVSKQVIPGRSQLHGQL